MDENEVDDYDREAEVALYREYKVVVGTFKYVVETDRRFYLANEVDLKRIDTPNDFYFEITMNDVWVWDIYRTDRFVKSVRVLTFKDVNVEDLGQGLRPAERTRRRRVITPSSAVSTRQLRWRLLTDFFTQLVRQPGHAILNR